MNLKTIEKDIIRLAESWEENPNNIAELLAFESKFYRFSLRNTMAIYNQNPRATYVQSYLDWKKMGYAPKRGEHGLKVVVPTNATLLKINNNLVPLQYASDEQKKAYKAGEIESVTQKHWGIGNVFDISQTTFPKSEYPKLFSMGIPSIYCAEAVKGLKEFAKEQLGCSVVEADLKSISLRGTYAPGQIQLNSLLEDTQKLSTLSHEIGHAVMDHLGVGMETMSTARKEFEADAFSVMLNSLVGTELTESRKRHLAEHYHVMQAEEPGQNPLEVLLHVQSMYRQHIEQMTGYVTKYLDIEHLQMHERHSSTQYVGADTPSQKQFEFAQDIAKTLSMNLPEGIGKQGVREFIGRYKEDFYKVKSAEQIEEIKSSIRIIDYAKELGYTVTKSGKYFQIQEMDSIRIDNDKNCFWRNSLKGVINTGSIIDFAAEYGHNSNQSEAIKELRERITGGYISNQPARAVETPAEPENKELKLPEPGANMRRVYAYLIKTRYLDQDIVQDFVDRKMLYQDPKGNCVFLSRDNENNPNFAFLKGTLSEKKFFRELEHCDYQRGFYIDNQADKLIVSESVIDDMSVMSILKGQGHDYKAYDYLSLNGASKYELVGNNLLENPKDKVLLALDNDTTGIKAAANIVKDLEAREIKCELSFHLPKSGDWNQDLVNVAKKFESLDKIPFLEHSQKGEQDVETQIKPIIHGFETFQNQTIVCAFTYEGEVDQAPVYLYQSREEYYFYFYSGAVYDSSVEEQRLSLPETVDLIDYQYAEYVNGNTCDWQTETESERERDWMKAGMKKENQQPIMKQIQSQEMAKTQGTRAPGMGLEIEM